MKRRIFRFCVAASLSLAMASLSRAQKSSPPSQPPPNSPSPPVQAPNFGAQSGGPSLIYGSLVTETGLAVPDSTAVKLTCGLQFARAIHPDLNGNFQFDVQGGDQSDPDVSPDVNPTVQRDIIPQDSAAASVGPAGSGPPMADCDLRVSAPGYEPLSKVILLRVEQIGGINAGTLVLTPLSTGASSVVTLNSLRAPKNARKEYEKGLSDIRHNKLGSAAQHFQKAVAEYNSYAAAWDDLGRLYAGKHQNQQAAQAFSNAIGSDPNYVPPYVSLADLQLQDAQFREAADTAGKALKISPGLVPATFIQAAANFRLYRLDAAETGAIYVERSPQHQQIPQVHVLLADILLQKRDYPGAADEMRAYLNADPQGEFAANIRRSLPQVEKLEASGGSAAANNPQPLAQPSKSPTVPAKQASLATLDVSLRLPDNSQFDGVATIRVTSPDGRDLASGSAISGGDATFRDLPPGAYTVEARAPGFVTIRKTTAIDLGSRLHALYLVMEPALLPGNLSLPSARPVSLDGGASPPRWIPHDIDSSVPPVEPGVACDLPQVLAGAGRRMTQFVENLQKFDATEHLEQFDFGGDGSVSNRQTRVFDYVAIVEHPSARVFKIDEYRNGTTSPLVFPGEVATNGLTAMALIFHPQLVSDFNFKCEGLGQWDGHPAWQIHFAQRADRPNEIRAYVLAQNYYPIPLKGRAWIDVATFQVRRLETQLINKVPEIGLAGENMAVDYGPVEFYQGTQHLWLPLDAQLYWQQNGRRFYRRHTFSNFKLFQVSYAQEIQPPKESYCFKNTSDQIIAGILTVSPVPGVLAKPAPIQFTIPVRGSVCKSVGPGKDVAIPVDDVGSAVFMHDGPAGAIVPNATFANGSTLDLVPETNIALSPR